MAFSFATLFPALFPEFSATVQFGSKFRHREKIPGKSRIAAGIWPPATPKSCKPKKPSAPAAASMKSIAAHPIASEKIHRIRSSARIFTTATPSPSAESIHASGPGRCIRNRSVAAIPRGDSSIVSAPPIQIHRTRSPSAIAPATRFFPRNTPRNKKPRTLARGELRGGFPNEARSSD